MHNIKKYWPFLLTTLGWLVQALTPQAQHFWAAHTETAVAVNALLMKICVLLPGPMAQK